MTAAEQIDPVVDFITHLYDAAEGHLPYFTIDAATGDRHTHWDATPKPTKGAHWWWPVATRKRALGSNLRGGDDECLQLVAAVADIDVNGPNHSRNDLAASLDQAHEIVARFPIPPTVIINSGGGLQAVWKLTEPAPNDDALRAFMVRWGATWASIGEQFGVHIDNVFDIARVMRLPGSWNCKQSPPTLVTCDADWALTYGLDDLDQFTVDPPEPPKGLKPKAPYIGPHRAGDAFNATHSCADVLKAHGWTYSHRNQSTGDEHWVRPGKDKRKGSSATVYASDGHCCVWTDGVPGLKPRGSYDPLGLYARLFHGGDFTAATRQLSSEGYGERSVDDLTWTANHVDPAELMASEPATPDEWPELIPIGEIGAGIPFPTDTLPPWMRIYVEDIASELQVPVDLPAMISLCALSTVATGRLTVEVSATWSEQANLYAVTAMPPGSGKSPAFSMLMAPIREIEAEMVEASAETITHCEQTRRMAEKAMKKAEDKGDNLEARMALDELNSIVVPPVPMLLVDDITPEALEIALAEQGGRLAMLSAEGGPFDMMTGRYSERANLDVYLKSWAGEPIKTQRVGRKAAIINKPALTIGLAVQPSVLAALAERPELAGRGLTARFMYSIPPDLVGQRDMTKESNIDPAARINYGNFIKVIDHHLVGGHVTVPLTKAARRMFNEWRHSHEIRRQPNGDMRPLSEWSTKLASSVARLSGLFWLADRATTMEIDVDTMARAITVGDYWLSHAFVVHGMWGTDPTVTKARRIVEWIKTDHLESFTVRDVYRSLQGTFEKAEDTIDPLNFLTDRGYLAFADGHDLTFMKRGRPSPVLNVSPKVHEVKASVIHVSHVSRDIKNDHSLSLNTAVDVSENADPQTCMTCMTTPGQCPVHPNTTKSGRSELDPINNPADRNPANWNFLDDEPLTPYAQEPT